MNNGSEDDAKTSVSKDDCKSLKPIELESLVDETFRNEVSKRISKEFSNADFEKSVKTIVKTICQTLQKTKIRQMTVDVIEEIKDTLLEFSSANSSDMKTYIEEAFLKGPLKPDQGTSGEEKEDESGYFVAEDDSEIGDAAVLEVDELSKFTGKNLLEFFTNKICEVIKSNPELISTILSSLKKRFKKFFLNSAVSNLKTSLEPISSMCKKTLHEQVIVDANGNKPALVEYLNIDSTKLPNLTDLRKVKKIEDNRKALLRKYLLSPKRKEFTNNCPAPKSDIENLANELAPVAEDAKDAAVGGAAGGGTSSGAGGGAARGGAKTRINKHILRRHKTLKRKLKL